MRRFAPSLLIGMLATGAAFAQIRDSNLCSRACLEEIADQCAHGDIPPILKTIYNVHPRRTPVVDEERGITWGVYCFNHRGLAAVKMKDGSIQPTYFPTPNTMPVSEIFKIRNGKIRDILGFGTPLPYGIGDGWAGPVFR